MQKLAEEHDQISRIAQQLLKIASGPLPSHQDELAKARLSLSRALTIHFASEDEVLGKLMWSSEKSPGDLLDTWAKQRSDQRAKLSEHIRKWTPAMIAQHWRDFGESIKESIVEIEALMRFEEREIYPLATDPGLD